MLDPVNEKEFYELVTTFQKKFSQKHAESFGIENAGCVLEICELEIQVLNNRNDMLSKMRRYIHTELNP